MGLTPDWIIDLTAFHVFQLKVTDSDSTPSQRGMQGCSRQLCSCCVAWAVLHLFSAWQHC